MDLLIEIFCVFFNFFKSIIIAIVYTFLPAPEKSVRNEIVLITGAGSGLGRLMAKDFARRGAIIVGWDLNSAGNEETASLVKQCGGLMYTYSCDVSKREEVFKVAERVKSDVGNVTILVNNAGIVTGKDFLDCSDEMIEKTMQVNTLAHFWTIKCFLPYMMKTNHGHIVTIASIAGVVGANKLADYAASKFANVGFTESLDYELVAANKDGVHTTTVCPYFINTGMFEGCQTRFPALLPVLEQDEVAVKIIKAVLINQRILYIPRLMYIMALMKSILPIEAALVLHKFLGAASLMDTYKGRQNTEEFKKE